MIDKKSDDIQDSKDTAWPIQPLSRARRQRSIISWVQRFFKYQFLPEKGLVNCALASAQDEIQTTNEHLLADQNKIKAVNEHLLADQSKIKAVNEHLLADQSKIRAFNEHLQSEQSYIRATNERLQGEQNLIKGGNAPERKEKKAKMEIAPGMLPKPSQDIEAVIDLAKMVPAGGIIVDVGSLLGMSASLWCIHSAASRIVCIDPWKYEPWLESFRDLYGPITKEAFLTNVPDDRIETIQGYSPSCAAGWTTPIDLYWEDADHSNPGCANSIRFWSAHVKPGGIACGHDFHLPDVKAEAEVLAAKWGSTVHHRGAVWWIRNSPETKAL